MSQNKMRVIRPEDAVYDEFKKNHEEYIEEGKKPKSSLSSAIEHLMRLDNMSKRGKTDER